MMKKKKLLFITTIVICDTVQVYMVVRYMWCCRRRAACSQLQGRVPCARDASVLCLDRVTRASLLPASILLVLYKCSLGYLTLTEETFQQFV